MYENRYKIFLSFIKGKYIKEITSKKFIVPIYNIFNGLLNRKDEEYKVKMKNYDILILNPSLYDEEIKDDSQNENYKNILILLNHLSDIIYVYDMDGNLINSIFMQTQRLLPDSTCMIQYQSNILLLYDSINFYFIIFSPDFKNYEIDKLDSFSIQSFFNLDMRNHIPICSFDYKKKIFKIFKNKIAILERNHIFVIKFNNNLIFQNKAYYKHKENINYNF